jgi:hypothetical protein
MPTTKSRKSPAAKKSPAKTAAAKAGAKKAPAKKAVASKVATKKAAPKQSPASKKPVASKAAAKKGPAKKTAAARKTPARKTAAGKAPTAKKAAAKRQAQGKTQPAKARPAAKEKTSAGRKPAAFPDFGAFPPGAVVPTARSLCLACIYKLFTEQMGLAPRTAYTEIRRYAPTVAELTAREPQRPFFKPSGEKNPRCPYCDAAKRWHARVELYRIEGGKLSDAARRALVKNLPTREEQFLISEEKRTAREVFFDWLERLGQELDLEDDAAWMTPAARAYLERREPQTSWSEVFDGVARVRRSQRLEEGWERDGSRLFLAPPLYNEILLVQYLVSRSHRHGGRTFEGRLTLPELLRRTRAGVRTDAPPAAATNEPAADRFDLLEQMVERLAGGEQTVKLHYITDRRDLLDKAREVYDREEARG